MGVRPRRSIAPLLRRAPILAAALPAGSRRETMPVMNPPNRIVHGRGLLLAASLAALLAGGCTGLVGLEPPEVSLVDLRLDDMTVFETSGSFVVRISNENPEPIAISGGVYRLELNGLRVGKGLSSARVEVPALGTATDEVTLHVDHLRLATRLADMLRREELAYRLKVKLYLDTALGRRALRSDFDGRLSLSGALGGDPEPVELTLDVPGPGDDD